MTEVVLKYKGSAADRGLLDAYDATRALTGFQRSQALTTHLVINGEIITHAPALKGASIVFPAVEYGSWKTKAVIIFGGVVTIGSVGKDSPIGHVVTSLYDYVLSETMGFHPDYDKTLQQQYDELLESKRISREKIDSLIEKTEANVADMHRPIIASKTAFYAQVLENDNEANRLGPDLNSLTYEYVRRTSRSEGTDVIAGVVSSYNINTYKGRLYSFEHKRPIPFELMHEARDRHTVGLITRSQHIKGQDKTDQRAAVMLTAHRLESINGNLKRLHVVLVETPNLL